MMRMKRENKHEYQLTITKTLRQQKVRRMLQKTKIHLKIKFPKRKYLFLTHHVYPLFPIFFFVKFSFFLLLLRSQQNYLCV